MSSEVRLAAMMPATCATVSTSPLGSALALSSSSVWELSSTTARAMAVRLVSFFALTSTMRAAPAASI